MNYFKKIIKKWRLINKLEKEVETLKYLYNISNYKEYRRLYYFRFNLHKALNKLHSL